MALEFPFDAPPQAVKFMGRVSARLLDIGFKQGSPTCTSKTPIGQAQFLFAPDHSYQSRTMEKKCGIDFVFAIGERDALILYREITWGNPDQWLSLEESTLAIAREFMATGLKLLSLKK